ASVESVTEALNDAGIHGRTIQMEESSTRPDAVLVVDQGGKMEQAIKAAASTLGVDTVYGTRGEGRFLNAGEGATREQAREHFQRIVRESDHPDLIEDALGRAKEDREVVGKGRTPVGVDRGPRERARRGVHPTGPEKGLSEEPIEIEDLDQLVRRANETGIDYGVVVDEGSLLMDPLRFLRPEGKKEYERIEAISHEVAYNAVGDYIAIAAASKKAYRSVRGGPVTSLGGARIFAGGIGSQMKRDGMLRLKG
ncbi:unnamed protein product, partial [marine sediment metagenome]